MAPEISDLNGKVAIVTGAAGVKGIGRATALALAKAGADVAVCDLYVKKGDLDLEGTANAIRKLKRRSIAIQTDITREDDVVNLVEKVVKEFGRLDIFVNNAGVMLQAPLTDLTAELWSKVIDTNLKGVLFCCREAAKVMIKQKSGCIVNIASVGGMRGSPAEIPYGISKAGVFQLTRGVAQELAPYGIRVNGIAPGLIATDLGPHCGANPEMEKKIFESAHIPLGRVGDPSDIADVVVFLSSEASRYMTGTTIPVDGGLNTILIFITG